MSFSKFRIPKTGLIDVKTGLYMKRSKRNLCAKIKKKKKNIVFDNVFRFEGTHYERRPSNYFSISFTSYQVEQIKKK